MRRRLGLTAAGSYRIGDGRGRLTPNGPLPCPFGHSPATPLNSQCPDVAWSRLESIERPTPVQRHSNARQQHRETLATRFHVSLLLCPTTQKGLGVEVAREPVQTLNVTSRKEVPRDFTVIRSRPDVFEINADVGVSGDGDEGQIC